MRVLRRKVQNVTPRPEVHVHPVDRLMLLAEQMQELSTQVLTAADDVRQEIKKHGD